jgi:hypothetical protein
MLRQRQLQEKDDGGGVVSEENFLRYRLQIMQRMPDGPLKAGYRDRNRHAGGGAATERAPSRRTVLKAVNWCSPGAAPCHTLYARGEVVFEKMPSDPSVFSNLSAALQE